MSSKEVIKDATDYMWNQYDRACNLFERIRTDLDITDFIEIDERNFKRDLSKLDTELKKLKDVMKQVIYNLE